VQALDEDEDSEASVVKFVNQIMREALLERFSLERLGIDGNNRARVDKLLANPNGIILITGPTGSKKSTTLYTFLTTLNKESRRIVTIEDPVENKLPGILQIAVRPEIDMAFARGLRAIRRADPNVVMIGEMRDVETAEIAIRAALTGHLVFSTLHTNDAVGGITRLIDMGVEPFLVASSVRAFLAQRLVRTNCVRSAGSRPIIRRNNDLLEQATREGMEALRMNGWQRVLDGQTTVEELMRVTAEEA